MGPLPLTRQGNRFVLVVVDHFTRWPEAYATADQTAASAAAALVDYVSRHGVPLRLLSDNGGAFVSEVMDELASIFGVGRSFSTAYHPQTNGAVERFNRTLKSMLSSFVNKRQDDWDALLPALLFAYRSARHQSTRASPFLLLYGREARVPSSLGALRPPPLRDPFGDNDIGRDFAEVFAEQQSTRHRLAAKNAQKGQPASKRRYDEGQVDAGFSVGV